jgi:hypothetical protein
MKSYLNARIARIERSVKFPEREQQNTLDYLLAKGAKTEFGNHYNFKELKSYEHFKKNVPISEYEVLHPYILRCTKGEENVLWPGKVKWFAKSSGTTNSKSKFIPLTHESIHYNQVRGGKDLIATYYNMNPDSKMFEGKSLIIGGSMQPLENSTARCGDLSAVLIHQMPEWLQVFREPSRTIILMGKWEEKIDAIVAKCIHSDMRSVSGVPTWMLMIFKRLLEVSSKSTVVEVWPNLELFVHGGVNFQPYRKQFENIIGKEIFYLDAYNASEGFFAFQDTKSNENGMLLHTGVGIFYEFIPSEEFNSTKPIAIPLADVEVGKNYAIVISTNGGLWRYVPGDTVVFTSKKPYRILVSGRTKHFINIVGEEVMVHNTDKAIALACEELNCSVKDYTVAPMYLTTEKSGAHEWAIEFDFLPTDLSQFSNRLDYHLQSVNSDYEAKRSGNLALDQPAIHALRIGTFYGWLASKNKLGGQHKVPRLSNERKYLEEIINFATIENKRKK